MSAEKQIFHETKDLSLAANGLLDVMLNLPDRDYLTTEELCVKCGNEPFSQIKAELDELMKAQFVIPLPTNETDRFRLYRGLVNIRPAMSISDEYLTGEDEYL